MENTSPNQNQNTPSAESVKKNPPVMIGVVAVAAIILIAAGIFAFQTKDKKPVLTNPSTNTDELQTNSTVRVLPSGSPTDELSQNYKDGSYDVVGDYVSPGGPEQIEVKMTLKDNTIADVEVISKAERPQTKNFQGIFIANYKPLVVGKNINEVHLTKVSGSSLTPKGFDDALEKIKAAAKA